MTPDQITALAATGESEVLEFKSTTGTRREALRTVCAMLNQRGGHVLFGVAPTGKVVGQQVSERTIEEMSAEIQDLLDHAHDGLALREIRARLVLGASERQVKRALAVLRKQGLAVPTVRGSAARWNRVRSR